MPAPDKLSITVFSGEFERVHYALVMASGAAAIDMPVTLFFTMGACRAMAKQDGWRALPVGGASGLTDGDGGAADDGFRAKRVGSFEELLSACVEMKVRFLVCEMGLRALDMTVDDLRDDVPFEICGVVTFLNDASDTGGMLFI
ncbi:MAG: DsrE/DsrF/DrsH-like family protein [Rhodospirillales bacterium]|nr:DsrE/DsrF/DrsH-like family protein [Rhodospirillales bacterium]